MSGESARAFRERQGVLAKPRTPWERMVRYADMGQPEECWEWLAQIDAKGYGKVWADGRMRTAHAVAWELENHRAVPAGMEILHSCRTRSCVNPNHLRIGTHAENMAEIRGITPDQSFRARPDFRVRGL